jgi:aspartate/glutamate racemase
MNTQLKIIGVLGGMGPEATAQFYISVIRQCQQQYGAQLDSDYPEMLILNLPIPDIVGSMSNARSTEQILIRGAM